MFFKVKKFSSNSRNFFGEEVAVWLKEHVIAIDCRKDRILSLTVTL